MITSLTESANLLVFKATLVGAQGPHPGLERHQGKQNKAGFVNMSQAWPGDLSYLQS